MTDLSKVSIREFMSSPALLGKHFEDDSWDAWRACVAAAYGLPLSEAEKALFAAVAAREAPQNPVRTFVAAVGRGGGKDTIAALLAAYTATAFNPRGARLFPGERASVVCLACDKAQASIVFEYIRGLFEAVPALKAVVKRVGGEEIELKNRVVIGVHPNSARAVRGRRIICAIFDEAAFFRSDEYANPDVELDAAISPSLARTPGSLKVIISSVHKKSGLLYEMVRDFHGRRRVAKANYVAACDAAGGRGADSFTAAIGHREDDGRVVLDRTFERKSPFDAAVVVAEIAGLLREYGIGQVSGDNYAGGIIESEFKRNGVEYLPSDRDRSAVYMDLLPLLSSGRVRLTDDKKLVMQLGSLERKSHPGGKDKIIPGPGHDDLASSAALALTLCATDSAPVLINYEQLLGRDREGKPTAISVIPDYYQRYITGAVQKDGKRAVVRWALGLTYGATLILEDFDTGYFNDPKFSAFSRQMGECFNRSSPNRSVAFLGNAPATIFEDFGFVGEAAAPVTEGRVQISAAAHIKSSNAPLADALNFRLDRLHEPLPAAVVVGIAAKFMESRRLGGKRA